MNWRGDTAARRLGRKAGRHLCFLVRLLALSTLTAGSATRLSAQTIAIVGGTVYPVSGPKIEGGTVLIRDGRLVAVGSGVTVPSDATRIDATGRWVTPGLIHAGSTLGLSEVGSVNETNEGNHTGDINAAFNVAEGIDPETPLIPIARLEGVTTAVTGPSRGLVPGQAVLIDLAGDRIETLVARSPVAMVINLSEASKTAGGGSRAGVLQALRRLFNDAQEYGRRKDDFRRNQIQPLFAEAPELEALSPVLKGELPVLAIANRESDIASALRLARDYRLRLLIFGGVEAWKLADDLAAAKVPVILNPINNIPSFDGPGARFDAAALLDRAGARVIVMEGEMGGPRNLRWAAGYAVRFGMPWDHALAAITLWPARALGVGDQYGSLESGKVANVVVWTGDPLDFSSRAEHVFIRGVEVPHTSRQTELLDRYRKLPPEY
jgi:imidazolonepropionase-like amidohydrolase